MSIGDAFENYLRVYTMASSKRSYPMNPQGDMVPVLRASIEWVEAEKRAAMARHPSASGKVPGVALTDADRCDRCGAPALYRVALHSSALDFCSHHWSEVMPSMAVKGWRVIGTNPDLIDAMYGGDRR